MSTTMLRYNLSQAGACATGQQVRVWWDGNNWFDSTIYKTTGSNGLGSVIADDFWYSNSLAVREWDNGSWSSMTQLCDDNMQ